MIKFYLLLLIFIANNCFCSGPDGFGVDKEGDSVFFTLPGQGSCSVIVKCIEGENVAVVLDAGASSTQTHVKFLSHNTPSPLFKTFTYIRCRRGLFRRG